MDIALSRKFTITSEVTYELDSDHCPVLLRVDARGLLPKETKQTEKTRINWFKYTFYIGKEEPQKTPLSNKNDVDDAKENIDGCFHRAIDKSS